LLRTPQELESNHNEAVHWRMPHLEVLGFLPHEREQLVFETRGAYSVPTRRTVDVRSGDIREFGAEWHSPPGEPHVFDWFRQKVVGEHKEAARPTTVWQDADLAQLQQDLSKKFPHRIVEVLDWSDTHTRVLVRVTGGSDPGRFFVYQRLEDVVLE